VIQKSERNTISSGRIGTGLAGSSHRQNGKANNPAADFINGAAMAAVSSSSLAGPGLAISLKRFSAAVEVDRPSADLADALLQPSVAPTLKRTSWSHSRKR